MSTWNLSLSKYNASSGKPYVIPKAGSPEHSIVKGIQHLLKPEEIKAYKDAQLEKKAAKGKAKAADTGLIVKEEVVIPKAPPKKKVKSPKETPVVVQEPQVEIAVPEPKPVKLVKKSRKPTAKKQAAVVVAELPDTPVPQHDPFDSDSD